MVFLHDILKYTRYIKAVISTSNQIKFIMAPKGSHIVISVSVLPFVRPPVRPSVRPSLRSSVRHRLLFFLRVVVCVRFSSETARPISPMLIPIYRGNNVDLQIYLHPSMTAGQGHKILQFCEFRLLS